jgi:hypothetical protein
LVSRFTLRHSARVFSSPALQCCFADRAPVVAAIVSRFPLPGLRNAVRRREKQRAEGEHRYRGADSDSAIHLFRPPFLGWLFSAAAVGEKREIFSTLG